MTVVVQCRGGADKLLLGSMTTAVKGQHELQ